MLEIRSGGKLFRKDSGGVEEDVTSIAMSLMFEKCVIASGVVLKDIFLLLNENIEIFDGILRNWCGELVKEGLGNPIPIPADLPEKEQIEYLELYWHLSSEKLGGDIGLYGLIFPEFHGIGPALSEDVCVGEILMHAKGSRINWGISFRSASELANYSLKLNSTLALYAVDYDKSEPNSAAVQEFAGAEFGLGHILHGIMWELSFHGGPDTRDRHRKEIMESVEKITSEKESGEKKFETQNIGDFVIEK